MADGTQLDTRVALDLHPNSLNAIEGLDDDTEGLIRPAREALHSASVFIGRIHDVRAAASADPTLTPEAALLKADDLARSKLESVTKMFDSFHTQATRSITALESAMVAAVEQRASQQVSTEVRAHAKGLNTVERDKLMNDAMAAGDHTTLTAILGAPAYLSGMSPELHATYLKHYNEQRDPQSAKRLKVLKQARDLMQAKSQTLLFKEMPKAVGTLKVPLPAVGGKTLGFREVGPAEIRAKRDAAAAVYAKSA